MKKRAAIKRADFPALVTFAERKIALFERLEQGDGDAGTLTRLKDCAERNSALLEAAQRGLGAALTQIGTARAAATPQTYGPEGQRDALGPGARRIEKRC